ncbi:MAG: glycosyltransferase family 2 protein [Clostridia bacterium]|nr:glycosyltransferase family 2 protein [Clostridia bacterium]
MPNISVIMPAYNAERTISAAVLSVLFQTYSDFELIIINDCSTDGTAAILDELAEKDCRITVLVNEKNSGVSHSRNRGVAAARGQWIAFLDSDDMWREDKLECQLHTLEKNPQSVVSYTASAFIDENGNPYGYVMHAEEKTYYKTLLRRNLMSCSSVMVKASVMKAVRMPDDRMHEDYFVWLTLLRDGGYACGVDLPLLIYRMSSNSKSSSRIRSARMLYNTYRAVGYSAIASAMLVCGYFRHSVTKRYKIKNA